MLDSSEEEEPSSTEEEREELPEGEGEEEEESVSPQEARPSKAAKAKTASGCFFIEVPLLGISQQLEHTRAGRHFNKKVQMLP